MLLTAVINAHREGRYLTASLRSAQAALETAGLDDTSAEVLLVLDRADQDTIAVAERARDPRLTILTADVGDCGLARNVAVDEARGEYVAFLDGDDLWGRHWITRGLAFAKTRPEGILHSQMVVTFGPLGNQCWHCPDMDSPGFDISQLLFDNCWTSLAMAPTHILREFPYRSAEGYAAYGYEDWAWNCDTIASGLRHHVVPQTVHFIRKRPTSLSANSFGSRALTIPHELTVARVRELMGVKVAP